jgi:two-component system, NtrC family, sensor histidine kinase HydH
VTIRKTLLVAFLFVSLGPLAVLTTLGYFKTREVLQAEIEQSLAVQAATLSADIDKTLFERLQNAVTWNRLEVMQDIQIQDVDKRLSNFLVQLQAGYGGVYTAIYCTDANDIIVASSDGTLLGTRAQRQQPWLRIPQPEGNVVIEAPLKSERYGVATLAIRAPIASAFRGGVLGELTLVLDWSKVDAMLDAAAEEGQTLAILDQGGRVIAASHTLRPDPPWMNRVLRQLLDSHSAKEVAILSGRPFWNSDVIVGFDRSSGYAHFAGFGWTSLIIQPLDQALQPVTHMVFGLLTIVALVILGAIGASTWVAHAIAAPIRTLTAATRRFARDKTLPPPTHAGGEVGELTRAFAQMARDIEISEQQVVRASKLAVVGEMAAALAHEIRTPLGILRSSAQLLQREPDISAEGRELSEIINSETGRLNRLVSSLLDGARARVPDFRAVDLHTLLNDTVVLLQAQMKNKSVTVERALHCDDPWLECDAEQMTQVILNLLLNALQVLPPGGKIVLACRTEADQVMIEIADNGPGIPPGERDRVFEAFFCRREGGIGLGLAIVQQIVNAHGGDICADASPALGGALFRIRLPRHKSKN